MSQRDPEPRTPMESEAEGFTAGPGVVATKSQAKGSIGGTLIGAVVGALLGLVIGALFLEGAGMIIAIVAFAVAGAVAGGTAGGFVKPRRDLTDGGADT